MQIKPALLLLLACCSSARDPFSSPGGASCLSPEPASAWRLLGVIGRADRFDAWLISPTGTLLRRGVEQPLPGTSWRVIRTDAGGVTLSDVLSCLPPLRLVLTGGKHVQMDLSEPAAD